ncbi:hypothetical protein JCM10207_008086 [Rhodosporidiobolus poonsookiae]
MQSLSHYRTTDDTKMDPEKGDTGDVRTGLETVVDQERPEDQPVVHDAVFGNQGDGAVQYRSVGVFSTSILMSKVQLGLGILALPSSFHTLGLVPGLIIYFFFVLVTGWCGIVAGDFKRRHPSVYSISDCFEVMFGPWGGEFAGVAYLLYSTFSCGSALLTISTALNAISLHATCTAVFVVAGAVVTWPVASVSTLKDIRWFGWAGLSSIIVAVIVATIAIGVEDRPSTAPQIGPWDKGMVIFGTPHFTNAMNAVANIFFCLSGPTVFVAIASEMRNPQDYNKALMMSQGMVSTVYLVIALVVYCYAGQYVASPALGTAGVLVKRISYGLALPGLLFTAALFCHIPAKWIFVRALRNSRHLSEKTRTHWLVWLSCTAGCHLFAYIVASAIPVFSGLVGLISSLFSSILCLHAMALMWLYDYYPIWKQKRTPLLTLGVVANVLLFIVASFLCVAGTYGSIVSIKDDYAALGGRPWSCADNSNSS